MGLLDIFKPNGDSEKRYAVVAENGGFLSPVMTKQEAEHYGARIVSGRAPLPAKPNEGSYTRQLPPNVMECPRCDGDGFLDGDKICALCEGKGFGWKS